MIKTREQRKKASLFQRRLRATIISLVLVVVLLVASILVYKFSTDVIYFTDIDTTDEAGNKKDPTQYIIKKENGVFALYTKDGKLCPIMSVPGTSLKFYQTNVGTLVDVDKETGEYQIKVVPDNYYKDDGEHLDASLLISVFKGVAQKQIQSVEVHNQMDSFKISRYDLTKLEESPTGSFVIEHSPMSMLDKDLLSYFVYIAGYPIVNSRLDDYKDFSEYGLVPETRYRTDENGNQVAYEYKPTYYIVKTIADAENNRPAETHKIIIGDKLIDGSGYYLAYENENGEMRQTVYIFKPTAMTDINDTSFENTILANPKDLIVPNIIYPVTANDYFDVQNFTINKRVDGALQQMVGFSYIDLEDREGTIYGIHPYVFMESSFVGYHPNYDNIDAVLLSLMDPTIVEVTVLSPTNEDKVKYGLMDKIENPDGTFSYTYNSAYTYSFDRSLAVEGTEDKIDIHQTVYISSQNERGNYYVFTSIRFLDATSESLLQGVTLDTITEVSAATFKCLTYDADEWIYPMFGEIAINNTQRIELIAPGYKSEFDVIYTTLGDDISAMQIQYKDNLTNELCATFHGLTFKDKSGNTWYITPSQVVVYAKDGTELKPDTRKYEHNALGEQVQVMDGYAESKDGSMKVKVLANYVIVQSAAGTEYYLRYENTLFKRLFGYVTTAKIAEGYHLSDEEESALITDPSKHQLTIKVTDVENNVFTYNFYYLTSRKSYLTIGEGDKQVGGFYVQTSKVTDILSNSKKFFAGEIIEMPDILS